MSESALRIRNYAVGAIALVLAIIISLVWKLRFYDAVSAELTTTQTAYETASTNAKKLEASLTAQRVAELNKDLAQQQVAAFRQRFRSLNYDLNSSAGAREGTFRRVLNEYYTDYGIELRRQLIQAADESGVIIQTAIKVQTPPQNPEDVVAPPTGFIKPLDGGGTMAVTLTGTLPNILRFFERINQSEILMTVGSGSSAATGTGTGAGSSTSGGGGGGGGIGFKLENASPTIKATFTLTPYLLASGPDAALPGGGGAAPAAKGAGGPGGGGQGDGGG